jgi:RNA polymerase sigma factor (sigma-70 family)
MYLEDPAFRHQLLDSSRHIVRELGLPQAVAEDVYQSVLTTLAAFSEEKLQRIDDLKAYAYKMLRHEAIRTLRKNNRRQIALDETPVIYSDGSANAEGIQSRILLKDIWMRLNDEERELLRMLIFGYEARVIASRLEINHAAARQKTSRLRKKLRELVFEVPKTT